MEKDRDFEYYLPPLPFIKRGERMFDPVQKIWGRQHGKDMLDYTVRRLGRTILSRIEALTGPLYTLNTNFVSAEWQEILDVLYSKKLVDRPEIIFMPPYNDEPKIYITALKTSEHAMTLGGILPSMIYSSGASFDSNEAISKTIGEFLERFSLLPHTSYAMFRYSHADLKKKKVSFLHPCAVSGFSEAQKAKNPHFQYDDSTPFYWVKGESLFDKTSILLPSQLVFWHYETDRFKEALIREPNTNGAAGMFTQEDAILSGIYELIQRDGFLVHWLNTIAPPRLDLETVDDKEIKRIVGVLTRYRFDVEILDVTTDCGVPAFIAVLLDGQGEARKVSIGGGCDAVPERAIRSAILEAIYVSHLTRIDNEKGFFYLPDHYIPFEDKKIRQYERKQLWANPKMFLQFKWFLGGKKTAFSYLSARYEAPQGDHDAELSFLIKKFKSNGRGYEIYYYVAAHPILKEFDFHAVKVIIPALANLYLHEVHAPLDIARLREFPKKFGYTNTVFPNPLPHPFP